MDVLCKMKTKIGSYINNNLDLVNNKCFTFRFGCKTLNITCMSVLYYRMTYLFVYESVYVYREKGDSDFLMKHSDRFVSYKKIVLSI